MKRGSRSTDQTVNKPLAIFATILVVAGIAGVAWVSSLRSTPAVQKPGPMATSTAQEKKGSVMEPQLLLVNDQAVSLVGADGTMERLSFDQFSARTKGGQLPTEGSNVATGAVAQFRSGPKPTSGVQTIISTDGTYTAHLGTAQSDGASVVVLQRGNEAEQKLVLRDKRTTLKDATLLGWLSDRDLAIVATATSSRAVYLISSAGAPKYLTALPDGLAFLSGRAGAVWYATATPGEGIESPSKGPSEIHRIDLSGKDLVITRDELRVISMIVPDPSSTQPRVAYTTDDGQSFVYDTKDGSRIVLGKRRPLLFLGTGELILRDGYDLVRIDLTTQASVKVSPLPEGSVDLFDAAPLLHS